jgi:hypothetical protein
MKQQFGFPYPTFTSAPGAMTVNEFVQTFGAAMHNPDTYLGWIKDGIDIRKLNPNGVYLKHLNLRTIVRGSPDLSHPDYDWIHQNHPEWILRDANGNTVPIFTPQEEALDFGNDAYLDWALNEWMPNTYFDATDSSTSGTFYYLQDNGNFLAQSINCAGNDPVCKKYTTDEGVQSAWKHMLQRFQDAHPNRRIFVNTGTVSYKTPEQQLPYMKDVLTYAHGYYSESLTNDHTYWNDQPNKDKRNALHASLEMADWLAANGKYFFPNLGMGDGIEPTQKETDYGYAFFNLTRAGDWQFYGQVVKDDSGMYQPSTYPEMDLPLGEPLEEYQEIAPDVLCRSFENATAYVNLSDNVTSIALASGTNTNSRGETVASPLSLGSFSGLTVYHAAAPPNPSPGTQLRGWFEGTIEGTFTPDESGKAMKFKGV